MRPGRRPRLTLIALLVTAGAAAWGGWRYFSHSRIEGVRNVVLISIDTCRADHLSCYGYQRPTTPNIDAVARDAVLFQDALTPVPMTTPAHGSMLTGMYPPTHGVRLNNGERLADSNVTLAQVLREAGYQTAAFVGGFPLDSQFGLNQGFSTYDSQFSKTIAKSRTIAERTAEEVSRPALAWLEKYSSKPFFLFLHYYDPHSPYEPPLPYASSFADDLYAGEIAYVDHWIGQVMDRLRALGVYDNTLVIITGDHGEGLGEHGEKAHAVLIYQSTLRVPLVIRAPKAANGRQVEGSVSLVDIVPTVLDLVGLKTPARVQGVNLRRSLEGGPVPDRPQPIYCESLEAVWYGCSPLNGVVEGPWKYIRAPRQELYDLRRDSHEKNNVVEKEPEVAQRMRGSLETMLQHLESAVAQRGRATVDLEALKKLQTLGYLGGGATPVTSAFDPRLEDPKDFIPTYEWIQKAESLYVSNRGEQSKKEWLEIAKRRPRLLRAQARLAEIAVHERRWAEAAGYGERIVSLLTESKDAAQQPHPDTGDLATGKLDTRDLATAHFNLAVLLKDSGKPREAIGHFEQALQIRPDSAHAHFKLGVVLQKMGRPPEAISHYEQALRIKPDYADAHLELGVVLQQMGKFPEAISHYEQAVRSKPDYADAHNNLGMALQQTGKVLEAIGQYTEAVRLNPDLPLALNNLAWIRATDGDPRLRHGAEGVRLAEHACQLTGRKDFRLLNTLAAAYAEAQRFPEAVATSQEALALARSAKQAAVADAIQSRVVLYRAGRPYREARLGTPAAGSP